MALAAITSVAGWVAVTAASGEVTEARAAAPSLVPIAAVIAADGTVATPSDGTWTARKVDRGQYRLSFGHDVELAIRSWVEPAGVTVRPLADAEWLVTFASGDDPVDTAFRIEAAPLR